MANDDSINFRVDSETKVTWKNEAKKHKKTLTGFIEYAIGEFLAGNKSATPTDDFKPVIERLEKTIAEQRETMNLWQSLYEKMAAIKMIQGRISNLARADPPSDDVVSKVRTAMHAKHVATLNEVTDTTNLSQVQAFKALQFLIDAGEVTEDTMRAPTHFTLVKNP